MATICICVSFILLGVKFGFLHVVPRTIADQGFPDAIDLLPIGFLWAQNRFGAVEDYEDLLGR